MDPKEETREAPSDPDEETYEAPLDFEKEAKDISRLAAGSTDLEGPVVPARRKLTISGKSSAKKCYRARGVDGRTQAWKEQRPKVFCRRGGEESASVCYGGGSMILQMAVETTEPIAGDM